MAGLVRRRTPHEWWQNLDFGDRFFSCVAVGNILGSLYGTKARIEREGAQGSDHLAVTVFRVVKADMARFQAVWNDQARYCQRQLGYEWTQMFKAMAFENVAVQYVTLRMWSHEKDEKNVIFYNDTWKELHKRIGEVSSSENASYRVIIDDSVRRMIY